MIFRFRTIGGKRFGGPLYDTADDIFADAASAYAGMQSGGGEAPEGEQPEDESVETGDVDSQGQGEDSKEGAPGTPDESAEAEKETEPKEGETEPTGKEKVDSIGKVREWGKGWEKTAGDYKTKLDAVEPTLKFVDEKFGGQENLNLAAEIYGAIANEDEFDPASAVEFLSENLPGVATKLVTYVAQEVAARATSTALKNTFGRNLSEQDIKDVTEYLANGKKADVKNFDFADRESIPDHLRYDAEGNERDPQILDHLWKQQQDLNAAQAQLKDLTNRVNGADDAKAQQAAADAIESYITENFSGIGNKLSELGLDKPVEGETKEIAAERQKFASLFEGVVMWRASQDSTFQSMYKKAIGAVAKVAANPKDRAAKANSVDYSRRIKAMVDEYAAESAEILSSIIDKFSTTRKEQVEKINKTKPEPTVPGSHKETPKEQSFGDDPFDSESIRNEVKEKFRASGKRW